MKFVKKRWLIAIVMLFIAAALSSGYNFTPANHTNTQVLEFNNTAQVYVGWERIANITTNKTTYLSLQFNYNNFMYSYAENNYSSMQPIDLFVPVINNLTLNFTFNNTVYNYSGIDRYSALKNNTTTVLYDKTLNISRNITNITNKTNVTQFTNQTNVSVIANQSNLTQTNISANTTNNSNSTSGNLTTLNSTDQTLNTTLNASFISPNQTYSSSSPVQVVIMAENLSLVTKAYAMVKSNTSEFNQTLKKNNKSLESNFFTLMSPGEYNVTAKLFNNKTPLQSLNTTLNITSENKINETVNKTSLNKTLNKSRATFDKTTPSLEILSPKFNTTFHKSDKISIKAKVNATDIRQVSAKIHWGGGMITQKLYSFKDNNIYQTAFFNAMDTGKYNVTVFVNTTNGVVKNNTVFFVRKQNFKAGGKLTRKQEYVTIKNRGRKVLKNAIVSVKKRREFNTQQVENAFKHRKKIHKMRIKDVTDSINSMEFHNITTGKSLNFSVEDLERDEFKQSYAINPEKLNFTNALVNITAKGTKLYKCAKWNYTEQNCYGEWKVFKENLEPGKEYAFNLTPKDPAFGESFDVDGAQLQIERLKPALANNNYNATQNEYFRVKLNVTCLNADCGDVNVTLDPINWWDSSWGKRKEITITNTGSSSLSDFPVYLNISKEAEMNGDFSDLRFIEGPCDSGSGLMDYEIENYDSSKADVWVKVPSFSTGSNSICMYYANSNADSGENVSGVWSNDYIMVHHLQESPSGTTQAIDSTYSNNGTFQGSMTSEDLVSGKIDGNLDFDGNDDYIDAGDGSSINGLSQMTISAWVNSDATGVDNTIWRAVSDDTIMMRYDSGGWEWGGTNVIQFDVMTSGGDRARLESSSYAQTTGWQYVTGVWNGTELFLYIDGSLDNPTGKYANNPGNIGGADRNHIAGSGNQGPWDGQIDEVRISNTAKSSEWVNQSYQIVENQDSMVGFAQEENYSKDAKGTIPTGSGEFFYTNKSNPDTITLNASGWQELNFYVKAKGPIGSKYEFFAYTNITANTTISNQTEKWNVTIVNGPPNQPTLNQPVDGSTGVSTSRDLNVTVTDSQGDNMDVTFYDASDKSLIGSTKTGVSNGSGASVAWSGLDYDTTYEWYVNVTDGDDMVQSDTWNFTTKANPSIDIEILHPVEDIEVEQSKLFNVSLNVSCLNSYCGDVNISLKETKESPFYDDFEDNFISPEWNTIDADKISGTSFSEIKGVMQINANGNDIWTGDDEYGAVYLENEKGNFTAVTEVVTQENTNAWAKTGIAVKNDLSVSGGPTGYAIVAITPDNGATFQYDSDGDGYNDASTQACSSTYPMRLKLEKRKNTLTGYCKPDGESSYIQIGSYTFDSSNINNVQDVGMIHTSHSYGGEIGTGEFKFFRVNNSNNYEMVVPTNNSASPFYTNGPSNPETLQGMTAGESRQFDFSVNATSGFVDTWGFFAHSQITSDTSVNNQTNKWNVTIVNKPPNQPTLNNPNENSTGVSIPPTLNVTVTDFDDIMNVSFYDAGTGSQIGSTQTNVTSGSDASVVWSGLDYGTTYKWYINVTDGKDEIKSETWNFTTEAGASYDNFSGETTKFNSHPNPESVHNATLDNPGRGKITWHNPIKATGQGFDRNIVIKQNYVYVNSSALHNSINSTAKLTLENLSWSKPVIYRNNKLCDACEVLSYENGQLEFNVPGFSTYTTKEDAALKVYDDSDYYLVISNEEVNFYANYTNKTSGEAINGTGVSCEIDFNTTAFTPEKMAFNSTRGFYEYNRSFSSAGTYSWNVSCNGTSQGYEPLNVSDSVEIISPDALDSYSSQPDFNRGTFNRTSADRNDNSGSLGLGYLNGTNPEQTFNKLTAYWRLDRAVSGTGGTALDYSGNNFRGTYKGGVSTGVQGVFSTKAIDISGSADSMAADYNMNLSADTPHTMSLWYKGSGGSGALASINYNTNPHKGVDIWDNGGGEIASHMINSWSGNALKQVVDSSGADYINPLDGSWHHIVVTYDGSMTADGIDFYVDGVKQPEKTASDTLTSTDVSADFNPVRIGGRSDDTGAIAQGATGTVDEFMIWNNQSLSSSQAEKLYFRGMNGRFNGTYTSHRIDTSNTQTWDYLQVNATLNSQDVNATFQSLDSDGYVVDEQKIDLLEGNNNYTLNVLISQDARVKFTFASDKETETAEINSFNVHHTESYLPPDLTLEAPPDGSIENPLVTFKYTPNCYSDSCTQAELFLNITKTVNSTWSTDTQSNWNEGKFYNTVTNSSGHLKLSKNTTDITSTGVYSPDLTFQGTKTDYYTDANAPGTSWDDSPANTASTSPEPPYSGTWTYDSGTQHYFSGGSEKTIGSDEWVIVWVRPEAGSKPNEIMVQVNVNPDDWDHRFQFGTTSCIYSPCNNSLSNSITAGEWNAMAIHCSAFDGSICGETVNGMAFTIDDGAAYWDSGIFSTSPAVGSGYKSSGTYESKVFNTEQDSWWKASDVAAIDSPGADFNINYAENSSGEWTYHDEFPTDIKSQFFKFNISMSSQGENTASIDSVNNVYNHTKPAWKSAKTTNTITNNTENQIEYGFPGYSLPQSFKWNIKLTQSDGQTVFADANRTFTVKGANASYTDFSGETTDFNSLLEPESVENATLDAPGKGKIKWNNPINATDQDFDSNVLIEQNYIFVNSSALNPSINSSAIIEIENVSLIYPVLYKDGNLCISCDIISYESNTIKANVAGFSTYSSAEGTELNIMDDSDASTVRADEKISFYANYTNVSSKEPITGESVNCIFTENTTGNWSEPVNMSFNSSSGLYEYHGSYDKGEYVFNVSCSNSKGYANLSLSDNFTINETLVPPDITGVSPTVEVSLYKQVNISANITEQNEFDYVDTVLLNLSFPHINKIVELNDSDNDNVYNYLFDNASVIGQYNYSFIANDSYSLQSAEKSAFTVADNTNPEVRDITPPSGNAYTSGTQINFTANVTDNYEVMAVQALVEWDGGSEKVQMKDADNDSIYNGSFTSFYTGRNNITIIARDTSNNVNNTEKTWVDITHSTSGALYCEESPCIASSSLIRSRDSLATPEPNQPNTLDSCSDGTSGSYQSDESLDNISVTSLNGSKFRAGDTVEVNITVFCWSDGADDNVNFVYANDSSSLSWGVEAAASSCPGGSFQTITRQFKLDKKQGIQAFRGIIQYSGSTSTTCGGGSYDDNDDLEFLVEKARESKKPNVSIDTPDEETYFYSDEAPISVNVSDSSDIEQVYVKINKEGRSWRVNLSDYNRDGVYTGTFRDTYNTGNHSITAYAEDEFENTNSDASWFLVNDTGTLVVEPLGCDPAEVEEYNLVNCSCNVSDVNVNISDVIANVTLPNGSVIQPSLTKSDTIYEFNFSNTSNVGDHQIKWWANNTNDISRKRFDNFRVVEYNKPNISLIKPQPGKNYNTSQKVNLTANATDDTEIQSVWADVLFPDESTKMVGLDNVGGDTYSNYLTETSQFGIYNISFVANDTSGNNDMTNTWINVSYASQSAKFCDKSPCIVGSSLIESRDNIGSRTEPNQPNTIDSCADGTSGTYASDESLENISMRSLNGTKFRGGDTVEVNITTYCYDSTSDNINYIYSNSVTDINWRVMAFEDPCPTSGFYTSSRTFVLDENVGVHAFRGSIQYNGDTTTTCGAGSYDDNDDFEFYVDKPREWNPPNVTLKKPEPLIYKINDSIEIVANITDQTDVRTTYANVSWSGGKEKLPLTEEEGLYTAVFDNTSIKTTYNVTIYANDTFNNVNNTQTVSFSINKSPYHVFYGNSSEFLKLGAGSSSMFDYGPVSPVNLYALDQDSSINYTSLTAIGKTTAGADSGNDFLELDNAFNMVNNSYGFRYKWAIDNSTPRKTTSFTVYGRTIHNVPYINSTISENFITGVVWDSSDSSDSEFDLTDKEDVVMVTKYNKNTAGKYGTYGFEIKIPGTLGEYKGTNDKIQFLNEI